MLKYHIHFAVTIQCKGEKKAKMSSNGGKHVTTYWFPKAPMRAITAYGVQDATNRKQMNMAALEMRISADVWFCC
jgi:hypothetical protein